MSRGFCRTITRPSESAAKAAPPFKCRAGTRCFSSNRMLRRAISRVLTVLRGFGDKGRGGRKNSLPQPGGGGVTRLGGAGHKPDLFEPTAPPRFLRAHPIGLALRGGTSPSQRWETCQCCGLVSKAELKLSRLTGGVETHGRFPVMRNTLPSAAQM